MEFSPEIFKFNTGITLSINEDKIHLKNDNKNATSSSCIDSEQIDNFTYDIYWEGKVSPAGIWFRFIAISAVLLIISENVFGGWSENTFSLAGILFVVNIVFTLIFIIDAMLQLNIFRGIIRQYFSNKVYSVTIGNKSGNNIEFYAMLNELNKIKKLDEIISSLKLLVENRKENYQSNSSVLDELHKLGELFKNGILTQEEFNIKKQEILNKKL